MNKSRFLAGSLLVAVAATLASAPAAAQRVDRIVAFGDSYADTGNVIRYLLASPLVDAATKAQLQTVYPTGRFSGGSNYVDSLSQSLGVPVTNFAIGGALTSSATTFGFPLGLTTEYQSFLAGGGGPFPTSSPTLNSTDLVTLSIGGNDARVYQQGGGTLAGAPASATAAVTNVTAALNALYGAGGRNFSYLAVNSASAPEIAGDPAGQAVRNAYSTTFNSGIQASLASLAAKGAIVNYTDLSVIGARIQANPAAYGLTSAGPCPTTCASNPNSQSQYLFYVDNLHLTSAGFAIVAQYVDRQMIAPVTLQATSDLALDTARQFGRTLTTRLDLGSPRDGEVLTGVRLFALGDTFTRKVGTSETNDPFKVTTVGGTIGLEAGFGPGTVGIAGNYSRPRARFYSGEATTRSHSYQIGGFAGFGIAGGFAQGYLGYGKDKHRITRQGVIDDVTASPSGNHWLAGAKAGYLMPMAGVRVGPVVGVDYARAKVDGYTESGDAALTLGVNAQRYSSLRGNAGIELRGDLGAEGVHFRPFVSAVAEKDFKGDGRTVYYAQTDAPGIVNHFSFADANKKTYARATGGFSASVTNAVSVDANVSGTFGKKQGNETSAQVGLNFGF